VLWADCGDESVLVVGSANFSRAAMGTRGGNAELVHVATVPTKRARAWWASAFRTRVLREDALPTRLADVPSPGAVSPLRLLSVRGMGGGVLHVRFAASEGVEAKMLCAGEEGVLLEVKGPGEAQLRLRTRVLPPWVTLIGADRKGREIRSERHWIDDEETLRRSSVGGLTAEVAKSVRAGLLTPMGFTRILNQFYALIGEHSRTQGSAPKGSSGLRRMRKGDDNEDDERVLVWSSMTLDVERIELLRQRVRRGGNPLALLGHVVESLFTSTVQHVEEAEETESEEHGSDSGTDPELGDGAAGAPERRTAPVFQVPTDERALQGARRAVRKVLKRLGEIMGGPGSAFDARDGLVFANCTALGQFAQVPLHARWMGTGDFLTFTREILRAWFLRWDDDEAAGMLGA